MINPLNNNSGANSIFDKMDVNKDNSVSKEEAFAFGFTTLGDTPLTRKQFEEKFSVFAEKSSTRQDTLEDFGDIFYRDDSDKLLHEVELSDSQRQELLSRMEMYEAYCSTLTEEEMKELIKIKSNTMGFDHFIDHEPIPEGYQFPADFTDEQISKFQDRYDLRDYDHTQYRDYMKNEFQTLKENLRTGKPVNITNKELSNLLNLTKINEEVSDGKIGTFRQGGVGDCWFLSQLNNYIQTEDGRQNISERIKRNEDGSYTVTFNNPIDQTKKDCYTVTAEEVSEYDRSQWENILTDGKRNWATGDIDVRILELATQQMLEKYMPKEWIEEEQKRGSLIIEGGGTEKEALVHRALGYTGTVSRFWRKDENTVEEMHANLNFDNNGRLIADANLYTRTDMPVSSVTDIINTKGFKANEITIATAGASNDEEFSSFAKKHDGLLILGHAYNLERIDGDRITFTNPHHSGFPHVLEKGYFNKIFEDFHYYPQGNRIPISECRDS